VIVVTRVTFRLSTPWSSLLNQEDALSAPCLQHFADARVERTRIVVTDGQGVGEKLLQCWGQEAVTALWKRDFLDR
jgi:hypothetical protein